LNPYSIATDLHAHRHSSNLSMLEILTSPSKDNSRYCNHSTVTDLARLRGKSTFKPSATASQYAMSWSGMTLSSPCNKSTVLGTSIRSVFSGGNSSSPVLQMTIGRPFRAMTRNNVSSVNLLVWFRSFHTLLVRVERLCKNIVPGKNHDDWQVLVYQCQDAMLELARHDSLAVKI
jgi:hypothetical protein